MSRGPRIDPSSRLPLDPIGLEDPILPRPRREKAEGYVELRMRSNFSFLSGASSPKALIARAAELDYDAVALTDRDGLYGMVRAHEEAERHGVRLLVGAELTLGRPAYASLTLLVENHTGYANLCRILTEAHRGDQKKKPRKKRADLPRNTYAGAELAVVLAFSEGLWLLIHERQPEPELAQLAARFGARASVAVHRHLDGSDGARLAWAEGVAARFSLPIVATNAVRYAHPGDKPTLDVLHAIRERTPLDRLGRALEPNAEAHLLAKSTVAARFAEHPEWLARSLEIADACRFRLTELRYSFPCELEAPAFPGETPDQALRRATYAGAARRYTQLEERVRLQIEKELALIEKLQVAPYFLSIHAIVELARARDILCQGRGSAANSAVCFCLGVTAVDPARSNLLFERFLSAERKEPPDIDVDFEHERREEVIQEIYRRYGRDRAAMVCEVISYRGKSALRDVGKAFGLSLEQVERLSGLLEWWNPSVAIEPARLRTAGLDPSDARLGAVFHFARAIQGFPRHLSIHVGGFILSAAPLYQVAPIEPATMPDRTIVPWDKDDIDTLGFFKVDVLGLGMLTAIRKSLELVQTDERVRAETAIDRLALIPPEDPAVYRMLSAGDSVGVFQVESRAQMSMLPRLKPRCFYDLVVEVAIVRPGPIQGEMVHPYLRRRDGIDPIDVPHPCLAQTLDRTLGIPLFQEQVMEIAIIGAGYTPGEADRLRRDIAAWRRTGNLERHRARLLTGFAARGISAEFSERLFAQIGGFAEYGFPESHAASFALLVYASSWIKLHHPAAFAAGLINSQPMGFYTPNTILQDAQRHGVEVLPIAIAESEYDNTLEPGPTGPRFRLGLRMVRGLGETKSRRICAARAEAPLTSVPDLARRAQLEPHDLEALAETGALETLAPGRRYALWKARMGAGEGLFAGQDGAEDPPPLPPLSPADQLSLDYARTGLSPHDHPLRLLRPFLAPGIKSAEALALLPHRSRACTAGMVICRQRPPTAKGVVFITMEDETGFINLLLYAAVFERLRLLATQPSLLWAEGRIEREAGVVYLIVDGLKRLERGAFPDMSRDFH